MNRKKGQAAAVLLAAAVFGGCASVEREAAVLRQEPYERITYQTTKVQRGDLRPSTTLTLSAEGYDKIQYDMTNEDLELEKLHVSVGDKVQKGDILVSFASESIQKTIEEYEDQKRQNELLVQHYQELMNIDGNNDYQSDIAMLREDIAVADLYIEEARNRLAEYQIVAKESGTITKINEYLRNGYFKAGKALLTEVCGTGNYSAATNDTDIFTVGETYIASVGVAEYELRLRDITDGVLTFEPISDMSTVSDSDVLMLTVEKPEIKNALYVDQDAVIGVEGADGEIEAYFVYRMKENGYREAVSVTVGEQANNCIVITSGVEEGEEVTLK